MVRSCWPAGSACRRRCGRLMTVCMREGRWQLLRRTGRGSRRSRRRRPGGASHRWRSRSMVAGCGGWSSARLRAAARPSAAGSRADRSARLRRRAGARARRCTSTAEVLPGPKRHGTVFQLRRPADLPAITGLAARAGQPGASQSGRAALRRRLHNAGCSLAHLRTGASGRRRRGQRSCRRARSSEWPG